MFILGAGVGTAPVYEGASEYGLTFLPIIEVERFRIPGLLDIGGGPDVGGFNFAPSFSLVGERDSDEYDELTGLDDIDTTYALGARVGYEMIFDDVYRAELYGAARYAFGGAEGLIGEVGLDVTARLTPQLEITGGPVVAFATDDYMDTYFGVSATESAASGGAFPAYDPDGGIKSAGIKLEARYEFMTDTFINAKASYSHFVGDALDSPIVQAGSEHQFTIGLGLSRRFSL